MCSWRVIKASIYLSGGECIIRMGDLSAFAVMILRASDGAARPPAGATRGPSRGGRRAGPLAPPQALGPCRRGGAPARLAAALAPALTGGAHRRRDQRGRDDH